MHRTVLPARLFVLFCCSVGFSQQATRYCQHSYCRYIEGSTNSKIIISAPHGGSKLPDNSVIRDRTSGCWVNGACVWSHGCGVVDESKCKASTFKDMYTKEIAYELAKELQRLTGERPHLIINELHRIKMDANRKIGQATFNEQAAKVTYQEYHGFIAEAKSAIIGNGLFLDIHGQTHAKGWHELGYLLSKFDLNNDASPIQPASSSIKTLASRYPDDQFDALVRGSKSLGFFLEQQDASYQAVPSPSNPKPLQHGYFSGGYNIKTYGSRNGNGIVDGIQVEAHKSVRKSSVYKSFAQNLAKAVSDFMKEHYQ